MHELALSTAIVNTVVKHAEGRRVSVVSLRIGALRQVVPDSLAFYFEIVARDSVCEGARLEQELIPARLRCRECAHDWRVEWAAFRCPFCASADVEVQSGDELKVESIEVEEEHEQEEEEEEEEQCIAQR
jgi:hydrogenase nickel incorporation protein HypA/HybF